MKKFLLAGIAITATALLATPALAIGNASECTSEGGEMVNLKGSDYCLVQIRPEAYNDPIYDGNQLGVTDCPGDKLGDGIFCMYPVTIRPQVSTPVTTMPATTDVTTTTTESSFVDTVTDVTSTDVTTPSVGSVVTDTATDMVNDVVDDAMDKAIDTAVDTAKDKAGL